MLVAKTKGRSALAVLNGQKQLRVKRSWREPGESGPGAAQAILSQKAPIHQRLINKVPSVGMSWIQAPEFGEELSRLEL